MQQEDHLWGISQSLRLPPPDTDPRASGWDSCRCIGYESPGGTTESVGAGWEPLGQYLWDWSQSRNPGDESYQQHEAPTQESCKQQPTGPREQPCEEGCKSRDAHGVGPAYNLYFTGSKRPHWSSKTSNPACCIGSCPRLIISVFFANCSLLECD